MKIVISDSRSGLFVCQSTQCPRAGFHHAFLSNWEGIEDSYFDDAEKESRYCIR